MIVRYLLDTNIVSSPIAAQPNEAVIKRLESHGHECAIAAPSMARIDLWLLSVASRQAAGGVGDLSSGCCAHVVPRAGV